MDEQKELEELREYKMKAEARIKDLEDIIRRSAAVLLEANVEILSE